MLSTHCIVNTEEIMHLYDHLGSCPTTHYELKSKAVTSSKTKHHTIPHHTILHQTTLDQITPHQTRPHNTTPHLLCLDMLHHICIRYTRTNVNPTPQLTQGILMEKVFVCQNHTLPLHFTVTIPLQNLYFYHL